MAFEVPPLPYAYDALEPHSTRQTMRLHHDKHHEAYVDNANAALDGTEWADRPLEAILDNLDSCRRTNRPRCGTTPAGTRTTRCSGRSWARTAAASRPAARRRDRRDVRLARRPKTQVNDAGVKRFGCGWTWLIHDGTGLAVSPRRTRTRRSCRRRAAAGDRRLGARVLPPVPEPPPRLPGGLVERRQLGRRRRPLCKSDRQGQRDYVNKPRRRGTPPPASHRPSPIGAGS